MTKEALIEYLFYTAKYFQEIFIGNGGDMGQCLFRVKPNGDVLCAMNSGQPLHGSRCADFVRDLIRKEGPVEAVAILSDTRMRTVSKDEFLKAPTIMEGEISEDESNPEALILAGRCAGYAAVVVMRYTRTGATITFDDAEPTVTFSSDDDGNELVLNLLPDDIWETIH